MSSSAPFFKTATGRRPWDPSSETQVQLSAVRMACVCHPASASAAQRGSQHAPWTAKKWSPFLESCTALDSKLGKKSRRSSERRPERGVGLLRAVPPGSVTSSSPRTSL